MIGVMTIVTSFTYSDDSSNVKLTNLSALQSSAGEMWCDQTNAVVCTITVGDAIGKSTGYLRASW